MKIFSVCVCVNERERETKRERDKYDYILYDNRSYFLSDEINICIHTYIHTYIFFLSVWNF